MGEIVLAAKITHVPSIWMSEHSEKHKGVRDFAIRGLTELGQRARDRKVDTFVIFDTHWIVNQGFHLNACERQSGTFTSHELPHFLHGLEYDYPGDPVLAEVIAAAANVRGLKAMAHQIEGLGFEYGTLIPMRHMNPEGDIRVLSVACNQFADVEENRIFGEAVAKAIAASEARVAVLASGSLSHAFWPNRLSADGLNSVNGEFNRQMDLRVLDLWREGRTEEFLAMLPDYILNCRGEVGMADTTMLYGALGWTDYTGKAEIITDYFGSSGTGQCIVEFPLAT
jgi:3,4-dihydroxyphenylacetate 2,3-dioxygenase